MCDMCEDRPAKYDAKTKHGPWAYMCAMCWRVHRMYSTLGTGMGQRLVLSSAATEKPSWVGNLGAISPGQQTHSKGKHTEKDPNDA